MKEAMAQVKREAVSAQLYNQSLLLQSHPFISTAILLGKGEIQPQIYPFNQNVPGLASNL